MNTYIATTMQYTSVNLRLHKQYVSGSARFQSSSTHIHGLIRKPVLTRLR